MKILIVGMINSIHLARWLEHLYRQKELKIFVFPVFPTKIHPKLLKISSLKNKKSNIKIIKPFPTEIINIILFKVLNYLFGNFFIIKWLNYNIYKLKPNFIHSHELSTSSILCLNAKSFYKGDFPRWIVTNWGSDLLFFLKKKKYKNQLKKILELSDYYSAECHRDFLIAKKVGTNAKFLECILNSGGINLRKTKNISKKILTSSRNIILIKGYHGLFGLALNALKAIEKIHIKLKNYKVIIYSADKVVVNYCDKLKKKIDLEIYPVSQNLTSSQMYSLFSRSKIYIGLSKSDGISTSLLEAMALGAFPIQSNTSCANEWVINNKTGFIVQPKNINLISKKILSILNNNSFVNSAAARNRKVIEKKANSREIKKKIIDIYK